MEGGEGGPGGPLRADVCALAGGNRKCQDPEVRAGPLCPRRNSEASGLGGGLQGRAQRALEGALG